MYYLPVGVFLFLAGGGGDGGVGLVLLVLVLVVLVAVVLVSVLVQTHFKVQYHQSCVGSPYPPPRITSELSRVRVVTYCVPGIA